MNERCRNTFAFAPKIVEKVFAMIKEVNPAHSTPLFSVVVPTHNRPEPFARAAASVANQSFCDFELIVVDDCSSQSYAQEICNGLAIEHRVITNTSNLGAAGSRNVGISIARGEYISFLDDDDEFASSFLESTYATLKHTPDEVGLSWCSARCINYPDTDGGPLVIQSRTFDTEYSSSAALFEQLLSIGTGFGVTIKASCIKKVGTFGSELKTVEDTDMFLRILSAGFRPVVVPGAHITLHNHKNPRLTSVAMHSRRIMESEQLLVQHANFLREFPVLDKKIQDHLEFLKKEISYSNAA